MTHTTAQPGLHAHSWDANNDLMKRYTLERRTPSGWLAIKSSDAATFVVYQGADAPTYRIYDQFSDTVVRYL